MYDFRDWVHEDPDNCILVHRNKVNWIHADRHYVRYIGKETNVNGDYNHSFIVSIEEAYTEDELNRGLLRLWEIRNDWDNRVWVYARKTGNMWTIHFEGKYQGQNIWAFHSDERFILGQRYMVELDRIGAIYSLKVMSENHETCYCDTGEIRGEKQAFRWVWLASTIKSRRNNGNWSTGYIEEFHTEPKS